MKVEKIHYDEVPIKKSLVEAWVHAETGRFMGIDEHRVRYGACDLVTCSTDNCNAHISRGWMYCNDCKEQRDQLRWENAEKQYSTDMLYSDKLDKFFSTVDDVYEEIEYLKDYESATYTLEDLRLYVCKPCYPRVVDEEDLVADVCPDDFSADEILSDEVLTKLNELNTLLKNHKAVSWEASNIAFDITLEGK